MRLARTLMCQYTGRRGPIILRHDALVHCLRVACTEMGYLVNAPEMHRPSSFQPSKPGQTDLQIQYCNKSIQIDLTCVSPTSVKALPKACSIPSHAANQAELKKYSKHAPAFQGNPRVSFFPFAIESIGALGDSATELIKLLTRENNFMKYHIMEQLSINLQRYNARAIMQVASSAWTPNKFFQV